jgi:uncharacterized membrane protein affecting hemolysin expression
MVRVTECCSEADNTIHQTLKVVMMMMMMMMIIIIIIIILTAIGLMLGGSVKNWTYIQEMSMHP